jgi:hypothetical protein
MDDGLHQEVTDLGRESAGWQLKQVANEEFACFQN